MVSNFIGNDSALNSQRMGYDIGIGIQLVQRSKDGFPQMDS